MIVPETPFSRAYGAPAGGPSPLPPRAPAVSTVLAVIPAPSRAVTVPAGRVRILDRDLKLAGIPKRDSRGWSVDVHALRHTFDTLLSKGHVAPRTAQAAMRHSSLDLTMNVYTNPQLLDVAGALAKLPELNVPAANVGTLADAVSGMWRDLPDHRIQSVCRCSWTHEDQLGYV